jgi:hypothetical protein
MDLAWLQNIVAYGYEGAIGNRQQGGRMAAVCAHGYFLGKAGQSLNGPEYTATNNTANSDPRGQTEFDNVGDPPDQLRLE